MNAVEKVVETIKRCFGVRKQDMEIAIADEIESLSSRYLVDPVYIKSMVVTYTEGNAKPNVTVELSVKPSFRPEEG